MSTQTLTNFVFWSPKKVENSKPPIYISLRRGRGRFKIPQGTIKLSPHLSRGRVFHVKVNKKQNKMSNFLPTFTKFNQLIPIAFTHFYLFLPPSTNFYYLLSVFTNFYSFAIFFVLLLPIFSTLYHFSPIFYLSSIFTNFLPPPRKFYYTFNHLLPTFHQVLPTFYLKFYNYILKIVDHLAISHLYQSKTYYHQIFHCL